MEQAWRWWGPKDQITLNDVCQTGATGIVTALHDVQYGEVWTREAIQERIDFIARDKSLGLRWAVVESLQVHERIKIGDGDLTPVFDKYRQSLRNLAACGVTTVCYNFMPLLDWTRTELRAKLPGGATGLRYNAHEFAAFDCFMLGRPNAEQDHAEDAVRRGHEWFRNASESDKAALLATIMAGLPGAFERYDIPGLRKALARYAGIGHHDLQRHYARFLQEVIPAAEEVGVRLAVHPDDPPRPVLGLPRVVSTESDIAFILGAVDSPANGLTFCTGALGASAENDLPAMARRFASRIWFAHLRNVTNEPDGSFYEADHLAGDVDMVAVVRILLEEQKRRRDAGEQAWRIPFRPDHGHEMLDDVGKNYHPGYPAIGRMRGLAEVRGVMTALAHQHGLPV
jgi:mannonate dehydratase